MYDNSLIWTECKFKTVSFWKNKLFLHLPHALNKTALNRGSLLSYEGSKLQGTPQGTHLTFQIPLLSCISGFLLQLSPQFHTSSKQMPGWVFQKHKFNHVILLCKTPQWLLINFRMKFQLLGMVYKTLNDLALSSDPAFLLPLLHTLCTSK